jgi:dTDP-glucose 4,6-dehydratase
MSIPLPSEDLEHVMRHCEAVWNSLRGARIFITGGTGFVGKWLLESFSWANRQYSLGAKVVVLSRNPGAFESSMPHLVSDDSISLHCGDVRGFTPPAGEFSHVIHAAASVDPHDAPVQVANTIIDGTRSVLEMSVLCGAESVLLISSGAAYGTQPPTIDKMPETYNGTPDWLDARSAYGGSKRTSVLLGAIYSATFQLPIKIARCFAFVGPHLPLDKHYAAGNFVRDYLRGEPIKVSGDGTPLRSYLYAADLAIWLWTILVEGKSLYPYNVGSEQPISIADLAYTIARLGSPAPKVVIASSPTPGKAPARYIPDTNRAHSELGLTARIGLMEALRRTILWYGQH